MATINYNGMKLEEYRPDNPETYEPPKKMLVWSEGQKDSAVLAKVLYVNPIYIFVSVLQDNGHIAVFDHCALLPDPPKPRRATNRELSRWLAQGNGECLGSQDDADTAWNYPMESSNAPLREGAKVRKWSDTEWHEPDVFYMEIEKENT